MNLTNAHVLVTGASRGIGLGLAGAFRDAGARLTLVAQRRRARRERRTPGGTRPPGRPARSRGPPRPPRRRRAVVDGPVDVLVNHAGIDQTGPFWERSADELEALYTLNAVVPAELARQALPGMLARRRGQIVNLSSLAGCGALTGMAAYSSTKAALTHLTAGLRADLRGLPVGTTVVEVGLVESTDMTDSVLAHAPTARAFRRLYRQGILAGTPRDALCAAVVAAVARDRRHVRLPRRARGIALLTELPRRSTELLLAGVRPRD